MPNWTTNYLTVAGDSKELNKFLKEVERTTSEADINYEASKLAFNRIIPMPDEYLYMDSFLGWHTWRNNNWNTKWEARIDYETTDQWESGEVFFEFATAWSAPMQIIKKLIETYPKLLFDFKCWEESYEFWAHYTGENGVMTCLYDGAFNDCDDYNQFGLMHHNCTRHDEWVDECNNSNERDLICENCTKEVSEEEVTLIELEKELWV